MRQLTALVLMLLSLVPASAAKADSSEVRGSVKWFCRQFETAAVAKATPGNGPSASASVQQCIELLNSGVAQKRFHYHKEMAIICAQTLSSCAAVTSGIITAGGNCESSLDCQLPLVCVGAQGGPPGRCSKPLALGQTCNDEVGASRFFAAALAKRSVCSAGHHCAHREGAEDRCVKD